jgi:reprolysin-like metallo-peptidase family M12B
MQRNKLATGLMAALLATGGLAHAGPDATPFTTGTTAEVPNFWTVKRTSPQAIDARSASMDEPTKITRMDVNFQGLSAVLRQIPRGNVTKEALDRTSRLGAAATGKLALPLPEGGLSTFTLEDSNTIPQELAVRYPDLRSFRGVDDQGRRARVDLNATSVTVSVEDEAGAWHLQPAAIGPSGGYERFRRSDFEPKEGPFEHGNLPDLTRAQVAETQRTARSGGGSTITGQIRYTFRIAITATSGYTAKFGGTREAALAGIIRTVNQLNEIFENDVGVHLALVADEDKLIIVDPGTDPFNYDSDQEDESNEHRYATNIRLMNEAVGESNYDVGILFTDQFGGIAGAIGNTCATDVTDELGAHKATGHTGHPNPVGDPFFVLIAAHELGHKFGAWHTFNGCERTTLDDRAFEPGSGSTVMSYAGVGCGDGQDLQSRMDRYFHAGSASQITAWLAGKGGRCAARRLNPNIAPWIDPESILPFGQKPWTIPSGTPFALAARVVTSQPLATHSYIWEQMDTGPEQEGKLRDVGAGPIFRSQRPHATSFQTFPSTPVIVGDVPLGLGEVLPATTRSLSFRLTARDNFGTQATSTSADATVEVLDTGKPFKVIDPATPVIWKMGTAQTLRWDVAGTSKAPINCTKVDLHLSINGGYDFLEEALASEVPNSGSARVKLPVLNAGTSRARIRVSCSDNVFFALSPVDFTLSR